MGSGSKFDGNLSTQGGTSGSGITMGSPENKGAKNASRKPLMSTKGQELLSQAKTLEVKNIIEQLYRPGATIGDGGTADALRHEKKTGQSTGGKSHEGKARERISQIKRILDKRKDHPDKDLLQRLLDDLTDALNGGKK
ncbi:MAG: hypothetical protein K6F32_04455 [Bacilli bacterium]|nr:hypothetical protein [Bacilli bacterium]